MMFLVLICCLLACTMLCNGGASIGQNSLHISAQSSKLSSVCVLFGFTTSTASVLKRLGLLDLKYSSKKNFIEDIIVIDIDDTAELRVIQPSAVAVGFLSRVDQIAGGRIFQSNLLNYVKSLRKSRSLHSQLFIVSENIQVGIDESLQKEIHDILHIATEFGHHIKVEYVTIGESSSIESDSARLREAVVTALDRTAEDNKNLFTKKQLLNYSQTSAKVSTNTASARDVYILSEHILKEQRAAETCRNFAGDFCARVNASISALMDGGLISSGATVNSTMEALCATLEAAAEEHQIEHVEVTAEYGETEAYRSAARICRLQLVQILLPVFRTLTQSMLQGSLGAFDRQIARLETTRRLPEQLRLVSGAVQQGFSNGAKAVQQEISEMIDAAVPDIQIYGSSIPVFCKKQDALPQFSIAFEEQCLQEFLQQRMQDTQSSLTLSGAYNPYLRDTDLPPIHINVNYLLDPKAVAAGLEFRSLYDEHRVGACESRADPLLFPGVAAVPFDPNQNPVSTEKKNSWISVAKEFFFSPN